MTVFSWLYAQSTLTLDSQGDQLTTNISKKLDFNISVTTCVNNSTNMNMDVMLFLSIISGYEKVVGWLMR